MKYKDSQTHKRGYSHSSSSSESSASESRRSSKRPPPRKQHRALYNRRSRSKSFGRSHNQNSRYHSKSPSPRCSRSRIPSSKDLAAPMFLPFSEVLSRPAEPRYSTPPREIGRALAIPTGPHWKTQWRQSRQLLQDMNHAEKVVFIAYYQHMYAAVLAAQGLTLESPHGSTSQSPQSPVDVFDLCPNLSRRSRDRFIHRLEKREKQESERRNSSSRQRLPEKNRQSKSSARSQSFVASRSPSRHSSNDEDHGVRSPSGSWHGKEEGEIMARGPRTPSSNQSEDDKSHSLSQENDFTGHGDDQANGVRTPSSEGEVSSVSGSSLSSSRKPRGRRR